MDGKTRDIQNLMQRYANWGPEGLLRLVVENPRDSAISIAAQTLIDERGIAREKEKHSEALAAQERRHVEAMAAQLRQNRHTNLTAWAGVFISVVALSVSVWAAWTSRFQGASAQSKPLSQSTPATSQPASTTRPADAAVLTAPVAPKLPLPASEPSAVAPTQTPQSPPPAPPLPK